MIFKQIDELLSGKKTQTRRLVKPGEGRHISRIVLDANMRIKWSVGRDYAVVPGRGKPCVWWLKSENIHVWITPTKDSPSRLAELGWAPLRIRILAIRREALQDISEADARAEGVNSVAEYRQLWDSINTVKGTRWVDNPPVWVLEFEVVK